MKTNKKIPNTCLGRARISAHKQITGMSLDEQVEEIKEYANENNLRILPDGEIPKEIHTGKKRSSVYSKHIQYIKNNPGKVGYYVITVIDRYTRQGPEEYSKNKKELANLGVALVDTRDLIKPKKNLKELEELGFEYSWSVSSPSEEAERRLAEDSEKEGNKILVRTIPKQIKYTQQGYKVRSSVDGYVNKRIHIDGQMRYISSPDPERSHFIIKMFELRLKNKLDDHQIVDYMNNKMNYRSKTFNRWNKEKTKRVGIGGGKKLTTKQLQRIIKRVAYAGITSEKWTHHNPVNARWDGLVSLEKFNKANRGKIFIKKKGDEYEALYDHHPIKKTYTRLKYNPEYPFKCIKCPICEKPFKGSASRGKSGKSFPSYHCARKHKRFAVPRKNMHNLIEENLAKLDYSSEYINILKDVLLIKFNKKIEEMKDGRKNSIRNISLLEEKQSQTLTSLVNSTSDVVRKLLDKKLNELEEEIQRNKVGSLIPIIKKSDIYDLLRYASKIVEHPQKTLLDMDNPMRQEKLMELLFGGLPTYKELNSGTPKLSFVFKGFNKKSTTQSSTHSQLG